MEKNGRPEEEIQTGNAGMLTGRRKYRRNFIDLLIVVLLVLSIVSFFFRGRIVGILERAVANDQTTVSFVIDGLENRRAENFGNDKKFYLDGLYFGELLSYEEKDAEKMTLISSVYDDSTRLDEFVRARDAEKKQISGTMTVGGNRKDSGFYFNGNKKIAVGITLEVTGGGQKYTILITSIS